MQETETFRNGIREYYGKVLKSTRDLKTNACCTSEYVQCRWDVYCRINWRVFRRLQCR